MPAIAGQPGAELLADRAYVALRDQLLTLRIAPGAPINEEAAARALGVGRTPVREAIRRLALENLVAVYPRRGTFAADIHITDLARLVEVRQPLEQQAARLAAARITAEQRGELAELLRDLADLGTSTSECMMAIDAAVHRLIYRAAANAYLQESLERYFNLSLRIWHLMLDRLAQVEDHVGEHRQLLQAIAGGRGDAAAAIVADHIAGFERRCRAAL